jgi:hypothetical protein
VTERGEGGEVEVEVALHDGQAVLTGARAGNPASGGSPDVNVLERRWPDLIIEALYAVGALEHARHERANVAFG